MIDSQMILIFQYNHGNWPNSKLAFKKVYLEKNIFNVLIFIEVKQYMKIEKELHIGNGQFVLQFSSEHFTMLF